jgi:FkbM family methyltransferase
MNRFPSKTNSLAHIKEFVNNEIKTVIDIGVLTSTLEFIRLFKDKKHVLVEPLKEYFDRIHENYTNAKIDYDLLGIAASNQTGQQKIQKINHLPSLGAKYGNVTASNLIFDEAPESDSGDDPIITETVNTDTVDNIIAKYEGPFILKIDVDGAEFQILEGFNNCDDTFVVVVESWIKRIPEFVSIMEKKGFVLYDITDFSYMRGMLSQLDLIFVNKKLLGNERYKELSPRDFGFNSGQEGNYFALTEEKILKDPERMDTLLKIARSGELPRSGR